MDSTKSEKTQGNEIDGVFAPKAEEVSIQEKRQDILRGLASGNDKSRTIWIHSGTGQSETSLQAPLPKEKQIDVTYVEEFLHCPKRYYFLKTDKSRSMRSRNIATTFDKGVAFAVKQMLKYYAAGYSVTAKTGIAIMREFTKTVQSHPMYDDYYTEASNKIVKFANNPFPKNTSVVDAYFKVGTLLESGYAVMLGVDALLLYKNTLIVAYVYYKQIPWYASNGATNRSVLMLNAAKYISKLHSVYKHHLKTAVGLVDVFDNKLVLYNTRASIEETLNTISNASLQMQSEVLKRKPSELCATCKYRQRCFGGGYYER